MIPPRSRALAGLLSGPSVVYAAMMRSRNRRYDRPGQSRSAGIPVISVGNLTVGGTGKTPLVALLARRLSREGLVVAVVSRGYGGKAGDGPLVVSTGDGPRVEVGRSGDEPFMLARQLGGVSVIIGADRVAGARAAAQAGAGVVVLDDGFQHRRLVRNLDIVLIDATRPLASERVLPAGALREPIEGLARAGLVVLTRCPSPPATEALEAQIRRHNSGAPILHGRHVAAGFVGFDGATEAPAPSRAVAFCAIGHPDSFRDDLRAAGVDPVSFHAFRDHHVFRPQELQRIEEEAERLDAVPVTTEKDLARLSGSAEGFGERRPVALRIELEIDEASELFAAVFEALRGAAR